MKHFFISYNSADNQWAQWIAWQLEEAGYTTVIQAWDFRPGSNFVLAMHQAAEEAERTIAVLSPDYLGARCFHVCKDLQMLGPELAFLAQNGAI